MRNGNRLVYIRENCKVDMKSRANLSKIFFLSSLCFIRKQWNGNWGKQSYELHKRRGRQIMSVTESNGADILILGAFGCGAFRKPPELVAEAYKYLLAGFENSSARACSPSVVRRET